MYPCWLTSYLGNIIMYHGWNKKTKYIFWVHASYEWVEANVFQFLWKPQLLLKIRNFLYFLKSKRKSIDNIFYAKLLFHQMMNGMLASSRPSLKGLSIAIMLYSERNYQFASRWTHFQPWIFWMGGTQTGLCMLLWWWRSSRGQNIVSDILASFAKTERRTIIWLGSGPWRSLICVKTSVRLLLEWYSLLPKI